METWYVMEDGSAGDPRLIGPGPDGTLRHKDGRAVAYAAHGPRSRGVDPAEERAKAEKKPTAKTRELKPEEPKRTYKTREVKAG